MPLPWRAQAAQVSLGWDHPFRFPNFILVTTDKPMTQLKITDDLDALLDVLPLDIRHAVERANDTENLLEIILDLGRVPTARFVDHEISLRG